MAKGFDLLKMWTVNRIRANYIETVKRDGTFRSHVLEYGQSETVVATGRAKCRCCGQKIKKGDIALKFFYDFGGCGSWTATEVQMHADDCK